MGTMIKQRAWAPPIEVDAAWKSAGIIARHRPFFFYRHKQTFPCDSFGFRIPDGHVSVAAKYAATQGQKRVFCFGGSTTFGSYLEYGSGWPAVLERLSGRPVFNCGLQELDLHANLYTFIDVLREGMRPDVAIFYDGINEKIAFRQAERGLDRFLTEHVQYEGFVDLLRLTDIRGRLRDRLLGLVGRRPRPAAATVTETQARDFALAQAGHYLATRKTIADIGAGLGIRCLFFLQPTIWDVWTGEDRIRGSYLRTLYEHICAQEPDVRDISRRCAVQPEMFYDACHLTAVGNEEIARVIMSDGDLSCVP